MFGLVIDTVSEQIFPVLIFCEFTPKPSFRKFHSLGVVNWTCCAMLDAFFYSVVRSFVSLVQLVEVSKNKIASSSRSSSIEIESVVRG